ncbi:hypothetical protein ANN_24448 [Periplaneta americana]|uniref:Uncharacterized protein n=1 Tax=Periplaneta americana TaxID=6978 RepID=A0ABQ8S310_PERAM|nr:hypothetical protein ANN_24448 [Periplaneta americana]
MHNLGLSPYQLGCLLWLGILNSQAPLSYIQDLPPDPRDNRENRISFQSLMLAGNEFQSLGRAIVKEDEYEEVRWDGIVSIVSWRERVFRLWWEERQGYALSTKLFNLVLEKVIRSKEINPGNDVDIISRSKNDFVTAYEQLNRESRKVGLSVNDKKTKYMVMDREDRFKEITLQAVSRTTGFLDRPPWNVAKGRWMTSATSTRGGPNRGRSFALDRQGGLGGSYRTRNGIWISVGCRGRSLINKETGCSCINGTSTNNGPVKRKLQGRRITTVPVSDYESDEIELDTDYDVSGVLSIYRHKMVALIEDGNSQRYVATVLGTRRAFQKIRQVNVSERTVSSRLDECGLNSRRTS